MSKKGKKKNPVLGILVYSARSAIEKAAGGDCAQARKMNKRSVRFANSCPSDLKKSECKKLKKEVKRASRAVEALCAGE